jgi:hypothetical protein
MCVVDCILHASPQREQKLSHTMTIVDALMRNKTLHFVFLVALLLGEEELPEEGPFCEETQRKKKIIQV